MSLKMPFEMLSINEIKNRNKPKTNKPLIGIVFEKHEYGLTGEYRFIKTAVEKYTEAIEEAGGQPMVLLDSDEISSFINELDGFLIPGGSDINPENYGEENNGSIISKAGNIRFKFMKTIYDSLPKKVPVFGVCLGFEFINVMHGGTLFQHIPDFKQHYRKRKILCKPGSKIHGIYGDFTFGQCYHHQGLKKLGKNIEVTAFDDFSQIPHAIELKDEGRIVSAVLFHPEITMDNDMRKQVSPHSVKILNQFVKDCEEYAVSKKEL